MATTKEKINENTNELKKLSLVLRILKGELDDQLVKVFESYEEEEDLRNE